MTEMMQSRPDWKMEINPYVSNLASKLMKTAANADLKFDSDGWQLISEVLSFAAAAEQRMAQQMERIHYLEQLSVTDELTGIPNRRGLRQFLGRALSSAARRKETGVLAFLDLDGFKKINDDFGHLAGDAVLRHVATLIKNAIRPTDVVARVSGDEFAVLLTQCNDDEGNIRMHQIQDAIDASKVLFSGASIPVKCSFGVQGFSATTDPTELIDHADQAMYVNKQSRKMAAE